MEVQSPLGTTPHQLGSEFRDCTFGDARLSARLHVISNRLFPGTNSFPKMFCKPAELEGAYRFFSNDRVTWKKILKGHFKSTLERIDEAPEVVIAHDTTPFLFSQNGTARGGLGRVYGKGKTHQGFLGHFSLAIDASATAMPLGLTAAKFITRSKSERRKKQSPNEFTRWGELVSEVEQKYEGKSKLIHVMDREGDSFALFDQMESIGADFVVRMRRDRHLKDGLRLYRELGEAKVLFEKEVTLAKRLSSRLPRNRKQHPARQAGKTKLLVSAKSVTIVRPGNSESNREYLTLNVVHIREKNESKKPIDWKLATSLPIESKAAIEKVIDIYQRRWVIEEYFKSLKTGCLYHARQQGTLHALLNVLAIFLPVAWWILRLRKIGTDDKVSSSAELISDLQKHLLAKRFPEQARSLDTVNGVILAIARLGGHIKYSGPPGWQTIYSGYRDLLMMETGILIMESHRSGATCDKR